MLASGVGYATGAINFLDYPQLFVPCPFRALTGISCPGCGMTRAFLLLSHLRLSEAFAMNPAAPLLAMAMAWRLLRRPASR